MKSGRRLTAAEYRAWQAVVRGVRPLEPQALPEPPPPAPDGAAGCIPSSPPRPAARAKPGERPLPEKRPKPPATPAPLADRGTEKRVRRGRADVEGVLDLHGHTQASALSVLDAFVRRQRHHGARCVLVITGKGRGGEGILRRRFVEWLETPSTRAQVAAYAVAHQKHGGEGAFYLFLRRMGEEA